ncbi:MAG: CPBP family intramembrane metalloprotease [Candidatus Diapherotrites archaeon]|nr:CPBP family intramembrane metalloprotease [Candidatus Diapherotrites archaeon]
MNLILSNLFLDATLIILPVIYFKWKKQNPLKELELKTTPKKLLINSIKTLALLLTATIALNLIFLLIGITDLEKVGIQVQEILIQSPYLIAYLLTIRVIAEEIFFRGFLTKKIGVLASSIVFAIAHYAYYSQAEIIGAFVLGLILASQYLKNKDLTSNIWAHALYNLINIILIM